LYINGPILSGQVQPLVITGFVEVDGSLGVYGYISSKTNWVSAGSNDGVWIQDKYAVGGRWKITFDSNNKRLYVQDGTTGYVAQMA